MLSVSQESELSNLVSDVVNENRFGHCRLCLNQISEKYVRFHDFVTLDASGAEFRPLSEFLKKALCCDEVSIITLLNIPLFFLVITFKILIRKAKLNLLRFFNNLAPKTPGSEASEA